MGRASRRGLPHARRSGDHYYHLEGAQRTVALSTWGVVSSAGAAVGLLFGGMLPTWLGWESVFFINILVGVATGLLSLRLVPHWAPGGLPPPARPARRRIGRGGTRRPRLRAHRTAGPRVGLDHQLLLLATSPVLLAAFVAIERSAERPLLPPQTWRVRSLVAAAALMLGATWAGGRTRA